MDLALSMALGLNSDLSSGPGIGEGEPFSILSSSSGIRAGEWRNFWQEGLFCLR